MFESAELNHRIEKAAYEAEVPALREELLEAQDELLKAAKFPLVILINGVDGAGKGETVNTLNAWMDPRHIETHALDAPTDEERDRPPLYRYWRALPPRGKTGIFFGSWYTGPILRRAYGEIKGAELDASLEEIRRFERMLANEGALLLKFWFHLSKKSQRERLETLGKKAKTSWRVTETDWQHFKRYDRFRLISERALRLTSTAEAPWIVVEGTDERYRNLTVSKAILGALKGRLKAPEGRPRNPHPPPFATPVDGRDLLGSLDLSKRVEKAEYEDQLPRLERKLNLLTRDDRFRGKSVVAVFEGADAAGKGGTIRRITAALDARQYRVVPIAAPTEDERAQPYLWRFWRRLPRKAHFAIFDRSWYGRVLVERVEGFAAPDDWMRAYGEINDFEEQLGQSGTVLLKFWLQISKEEQLRRFQERETVAFKHYKLTDEDWRNRDKWDAYRLAVCEMVDRTSTEIAPWTLVAAEDKNHARLEVMRTVCERLEAALAR